MDPYADDSEQSDPSTLASIGVDPAQADGPGFNWAGLTDFIQGVTPTAFGIVSAITDKPINVSGSDSSGRAMAVSAGASPISAVAGLGAAPVTTTAFGLSSTALLLVLGGGALLAFALLNK